MNCKSCNRKMPLMAKICPACRMPQTGMMTITGDADAKEFAFHAEYFDAESLFERSFAEYDDYIYELIGDKSRIYRYKKREASEYVELENSAGNGDGLVVNRHGFFVCSNEEVTLYDFAGKMKGKLNCDIEGYKILPKYVYGTKLYYVKCRKDGNLVEKQDAGFYEHDFANASARCIFKMRDIAQDIYQMVLDMAMAEAINYGDDGEDIPKSLSDEDVMNWYSECSIGYGYVNDRRAILKLDYHMEDGGDIYGGLDGVVIDIDLNSLEYNVIKEPAYDRVGPGKGNRFEIVRFDMLNNQMWVRLLTKEVKNEITFYGCDIKPLSEIDLNSDVNRTWVRGDGELTLRNTYFDGKHMYYGKSYLEFFSYGADGSRDEWNQSGHGGADKFNVLGDWVYVVLDRFYMREAGYHVTFLPQSVTFPKEESFLEIKQSDIDSAVRVSTFDEPGAVVDDVETCDMEADDSPAVTVMFCPYCGTKMPAAGAKFCFACGQELPTL